MLQSPLDVAWNRSIINEAVINPMKSTTCNTESSAQVGLGNAAIEYALLWSTSNSANADRPVFCHV